MHNHHNGSKAKSKKHVGGAHGSSSTGDMNKVVYKPKHLAKGTVKRKIAFKKKVEEVLEAD